MEFIRRPRTKKQKAIAAMHDFHQWLVKMNNIHIANVSEMSEAYQKVYQSNIQ